MSLLKTVRSKLGGKSLDDEDEDGEEQVDVVPLTGPGGVLDHGQELRRVAALLSNGLLIVSVAHQKSPTVLSLLRSAKREGIEITEVREVTDLQEVAQVYGDTNLESVAGISVIDRAEVGAASA